MQYSYFVHKQKQEKGKRRGFRELGEAHATQKRHLQRL